MVQDVAAGWRILPKATPTITIFVVTVLVVVVTGTSMAHGFSLLPNNPNNRRHYKKDSSSSPVDDDNYYARLNFHQVLEQVGKTVLRPGGSQATDKLQTWAGSFLTSGDGSDGSSGNTNNTNNTHTRTVLEVAAGLGKSGIQLAKRYGCHVVLTDRDDSRLKKAQERVNAGTTPVGQPLGSLVTTQHADMFHLDRDLLLLGGGDADLDSKPRFDLVSVEAALTHAGGRAKKLAFLRQAVVQQTAHILLHEICFPDELMDSPATKEGVQKDMAKALQIGFFPESRNGFPESRNGWRYSSSMRPIIKWNK
jgi:hypothetical protein